jgi:hypothetical protein
MLQKEKSGNPGAKWFALNWSRPISQLSDPFPNSLFFRQNARYDIQFRNFISGLILNPSNLSM